MCRGGSDSITSRILRRRFSCNPLMSAVGFIELLPAAAGCGEAPLPLDKDGLPPFFLTAERNSPMETPFTILFQTPTAVGGMKNGTSSTRGVFKHHAPY